MKKMFLLSLLTMVTLNSFAAETYRDKLAPWLIQLRDAVYEQVLGVDAVYSRYTAAKTRAEAELSGAERLNALSLCEYFMGRTYQYYKQDNKALECYEKGYSIAENSLKTRETSDGWVLRSNNLAQMCTIKSTAFVMANGLDVGKYASNALKLNSRNSTAQHTIASRWIYAPAPFNDTKKGISMMKEILSGNYEMQKDDLFNVYTALAYGYLRDKNKDEARIWIDKALTIYPSNKYVGQELKGQL